MAVGDYAAVRVVRGTSGQRVDTGIISKIFLN